MKVKKLFALLLAIAMMFTLSTAVFADGTEETSPIPENATKHTLTVQVDPNDSTDIWGQLGATSSSGSTSYTSAFYVSDPFFAFEVSATGTNGNASSQYYTTNFQYSSGGFIAGCCATADGGVSKVDWISIDASTTYCFQIINYTSYTLSVSITYYSWT